MKQKFKSKNSGKQKRLSENEEIKLLNSWIESQKPDSGSNPMSLPPPPPNAPIGRIDDDTYSRYAGATRFDQLPISSKTKDGLRKAEFIDMTDIQKASLPHALCGRDILGAAKTGSGKTLAFLIPVLEKLYRERWGPEFGVGSIIISPTRELGAQLFDVLKAVGKFHNFSAGLLIGGRKDVNTEKEHVNELNILVCTPGRLLQHMDETPNFDCSQLQVLVLDEADRILDVGFKKTLNAIISQLPKHRQTFLFSATQTKSVQDLARLSLKDPEYLSVHEESTTATPNSLQQTAMVVPLEQKLDMLWSFIKAHLNSKILVFLSSCKQVKFVFETFKKLRPGIPLKCLHGRMKQDKRMGIYSEFCEKRSVLFSTDVASRGLDFNKAVDWVVQVDCPEDVASYIHRVGRTARYHSGGKSVLFIMPSEMKMLEQLESAKVPIQLIKANTKRLQPVSGLLSALLVKYPNFHPAIHWAKPQGAIPLSIFGEEEEKEEMGSDVVGSSVGFGEISFVGKESGSAKKGGSLGVGVGIDDLISNLYGPNHQIKAGSPLKSSMAFDPLNFNNSLDLKSIDSNFNVNGVHSYGSQTNFDGDALNFEANGVMSNGFQSELKNVGESIEEDDEEVDDFDGWEFKAAESVTPTGDYQNSKVDRSIQEGFDGVGKAFESTINGHNHGDSVVQSNGAVNNIDEWDFGFSLDAIPVAQNGVLPNSHNKNGQNDLDNGLNPSPIERDVNDVGHVWDFKDTFSDAPDYKLEESESAIFTPNGVEVLVLNGSVDVSLFASDGISHKSGEQQNFDSSFNLNWGKEDGKSFNGNQGDNFHATGKDLNTSLVNENDDFNENIWDFKSALSDSGSNNKVERVEFATGFEAPAFGFSNGIQKNSELLSSHHKALPLSIFGDEELETTDDFSMNQDASTFVSVTREGLDNKNPGPTVSINDLISSLYSQAENNGSIKSSPEENENGIISSPRMSHSDFGNDDDDDSWEFKDASPDVNILDQTYATTLGDVPRRSSTKLKFDCYVDFYHKLNLVLNHVVHGLLENLKKAQSNACLSGEEAEVRTICEELQIFSAELSQENIAADSFSSDIFLPENNTFSELLEMLRDPRFQILDEEFQLSERLLLAENDLRSAVELLKHVVSTLKILKLGSVEEQSNYVSIWNEIIFICFQELKHGALIWKESIQRNVGSYILSEPQGKQYICALGEIYRVAQVLRASFVLYKPWVLLGQVDPNGLISLVNECSNIWLSSGLVGALCKIDGPIDCKALLDSINAIDNLDEWGLRKHVLFRQQPICNLSLLSAESIPGMDLVVWNGENYFLKLANLWANLIGRDPPIIQHSSNR